MDQPIGTEGMPSPIGRRAVSALIVGHLAAILVAVVSYPSPGFPAPLLAVKANPIVQLYLQSIFLNNAYRFFAPNPSTPVILWFRVQYEDRQVRWVELPGTSSRWWRAPYQRRLNLAIQLGSNLDFVPTADGKKALTPFGRTLLESAVRHVAFAYRRGAEGASGNVRSVGVYRVLHAVRSPEQVREGWEAIDLRTYRASFAGAYTPGGERFDQVSLDPDQPISRVTASIVEVDVLPREGIFSLGWSY